MPEHPATTSSDRLRPGRVLRAAGVSMLASLLSIAPAAANQTAEIEQLRREVEALLLRIQRLEDESRSGVAAAARPGADVGETAEPTLEGPAVAGSERVARVDSDDRTEPAIRIGGALRFNYFHRDFSDASKSKYGESGFDLFRLNIDGQIDNFLISAEYRHYSYMQTIRYGWIGYEFGDGSQLQFGIHQVPFGLLPFAAHNAWFGVPYYVGLADDYDFGVRYERRDGPWSTHLAFYKNEELNDATDLDRYSFDLVQSGDQQNEELNQFNARVAYTFGLDTGCETELGVSGQIAEIYNAQTDRKGDHWAAAVHLDRRCGRWNLQLQAAGYEYRVKNPPGVDRRTVQVGAFSTFYGIDSRAQIAVANIAYNFDTPWEPIDQLICYNDYSRLFKSLDGAADSQINTTGCAVGVGPIFIYLDHILARDMAFFGNGSMARGGERRWRSRFNVNVGFYW